MPDNPHIEMVAFMWQQYATTPTVLKTTEGVTFTITDRYTPQPLADGIIISQSRILRMGQTKSGNVIFVAKSSDFNKSRAITAQIRNSTIMVVTLDADQFVCDSQFRDIDILQLEISHHLSASINNLLAGGNAFCREYLRSMQPITRVNIMERLIVDRLRDKSNYILTHHQRLGGNWSDTFVYMLFEAISIANQKNRRLFGQLADNIRYGHIAKELSTIEQCEALVLGAAGLLDNTPHSDEYLYMLRGEFVRLQRHYKINMINRSAWSARGGARVANIEILAVYLAHYLHNYPDMMGTILTHQDLNHLALIMRADTSLYWNGHEYLGAAPSSDHITRQMASKRCDLMVLNYALPMIYSYQRIEHEDDSAIIERILDEYLPCIKAEENAVVSSWAVGDYKPLDSFDAQALLQLTKVFCKNRRCITCQVGRMVLADAMKR